MPPCSADKPPLHVWRGTQVCRCVCVRADQCDLLPQATCLDSWTPIEIHKGCTGAPAAVEQARAKDCFVRRPATAARPSPYFKCSTRSYVRAEQRDLLSQTRH